MKILFAAAAVTALLVLSGCSAQMPEGYDTLKSAKGAYEKLNSAHVTMTDLTAAEQIMDFTFYLNADNEMVLSYYGKDGDEEQYAYSDGAEYFYKTGTDEKWTVISSSDENYIYNLYRADYRYPYAQGGIFFLDGGSVESAEVTAGADRTEITYVYNPDKLNGETVSLIEGVTHFNSLTTTFTLDAQGNITDFVESGSVIDADGLDNLVNIRISVDHMNEITSIENPVDEIAK